MNDSAAFHKPHTRLVPASAHTSSSTIPAFDIREAITEQRAQLLEAFARVIDSGTLILGPEVAALESEFAAFVHANYAVGAASGTDALIVALRALGLHKRTSRSRKTSRSQATSQSKEIERRREIITTANGPVPTAAAIRAVGAIPRFVDVDSGTLQITASAVEAAITDETVCVIVVHLYGYPAPVDEVAALCRKRGILLVEDCAQAHGTYIGGRHAGVWGDIGCFSFYPTKNLGALGDAGLCVTKDAQLAERMREQACYGFRGDRVAHVDGLNCRLDELQAALLRVRLRSLPVWLERRQQIAARYLSGLVDAGLQLPCIKHGGTSAWHQFVIGVKQRAKWFKWFSRHEIGFGVHYASPLHLMPAYRFLGYRPGSLPVTERACEEVLSLPMYPELSDAQVERVIEIIIDGVRAGLN